MKRSAIVLLACLLAACSRGAHAVRSDTLILDQQREPMSLNVALENGTNTMEWGELLYQFMVKYDDRGQVVGDAATVVPSLANGGVSRDGRTVTYHLRPNLRFSDGVALTSADCAFSIAAILNPNNNVQSRYGYDDIAIASAPDPLTCVLHLKRPFAPLLALVFAPQGFPLLPKHLLAQYPNFNRLPFSQHPIGSGPYRVVVWNHGDDVEMVPNPYYYAGKPKLAHLIVRFVSNPTTSVDRLRTGETDGLFNDESRGDAEILRGLRGYRMVATPINAVGALIFNTSDPLTRDARVRTALAQAIDIHSLIAKTYRGAMDSHAAGRGLFIWAYDPKAYPDIPYDPANADRLLDAAGWPRGADGVRTKGTRRMSILLIVQANTPGDAEIGNEIVQYERAVGVEATIKEYNPTLFVAPVAENGPVYSGHFEMALYPFLNGDDPDTTDQFACTNVPPRGYNKSRICDPTIDALLARGRSTFDPAIRKAVYAQLQARLYAQLPIALLYQGRQINTFTTRLHHESGSLSSPFWNAAGWTL
jgi:peptide/nickel transport system substrate-binding protein